MSFKSHRSLAICLKIFGCFTLISQINCVLTDGEVVANVQSNGTTNQHTLVMPESERSALNTRLAAGEALSAEEIRRLMEANRGVVQDTIEANKEPEEEKHLVAPPRKMLTGKQRKERDQRRKAALAKKLELLKLEQEVKNEILEKERKREEARAAKRAEQRSMTKEERHEKWLQEKIERRIKWAREKKIREQRKKSKKEKNSKNKKPSNKQRDEIEMTTDAITGKQLKHPKKLSTMQKKSEQSPSEESMDETADDDSVPTETLEESISREGEDIILTSSPEKSNPGYKLPKMLPIKKIFNPLMPSAQKEGNARAGNRKNKVEITEENLERSRKLYTADEMSEIESWL